MLSPWLHLLLSCQAPDWFRRFGDQQLSPPLNNISLSEGFSPFQLQPRQRVELQSDRVGAGPQWCHFHTYAASHSAASLRHATVEARWAAVVASATPAAAAPAAGSGAGLCSRAGRAPSPGPPGWWTQMRSAPFCWSGNAPRASAGRTQPAQAKTGKRKTSASQLDSD